MASNAPPRGRVHTGHYTGKYEVLGDADLSPEEAAAARAQIDQAESERIDVHITLRWGTQQLDIVRRAARVAGIPYQTYLKEAVIRRAIEDLRGAREIGIELPPPTTSRPQPTAEARDLTEDSLMFREIRSSDVTPPPTIS